MAIFVQKLTNEEKFTLEELHKWHPRHLPRKRAHAILLSHQAYSVSSIGDIYGACRQTVTHWLSQWEKNGICGLFDSPGRGRPRKINQVQREAIVEKVKASPRSLKKIVADIAREMGISISLSTVKRLCKEAGLIWKRVRKSLRSKRDQEAFDAAYKEMEALIDQHEANQIDLWYFDESGFTLEPCTSYAWQPKCKTIEIPSSKSKRLNVLGFVSRVGEFESVIFEGGVTTTVVVACIDRFSDQIKRPTTLVIDNAPTHTSHEFNDCVEGWKEKGLTIYRIPPYSPELNLIEIVWRKIKYEWLPFSAYNNYASLKQNLFDVLSGIGGSYKVTFS